MLMQPIKLQLKSCLFPYILNLIISLLSIILIKIFKNELKFYVIVFIVELIFSFFYGFFNITILGKTYSSLKHDKHNFCLSSLIINILNALIMLIIFTIVNIFVNANNSILTNIFAFIIYLSIHMLFFTLGSFYALFIVKYKLIDTIALIFAFTLAFIFSNFIINSLTTFINNLQNINVSTYILFIINVLLIFSLNILNAFKYRHQ